MSVQSYVITETQFLAAQHLHISLRSAWQKLLLIVLRLLGLLIVTVSLYQGTYWLTLAGCIALFHPWLQWVFSTRPQLQHSYRHSPTLHQTFHAEIRDGQLRTGADSAGEIPWEHIIGWAEDEHSLLLYLQPQFFLIFPKIAELQPDLTDPLRAQLLTRLGPPRK